MSAAAYIKAVPTDAANDEAPTADEVSNLATLSERVKFTPQHGEVLPLFDPADFRASRYLRTEPPARCWLVNEVIPAGIVFQMVAPGGTGKTMASLQLGVACATGLPFAGIWEVREAGPVLMLLGEDDENELHRRIANIADHIAQDNAEAMKRLGENLYIKYVIGEDCLLTTATESREVAHTPLVDRLILTAQQIPGLKLIVIDPASRFRGGEENVATDTTRFIQALERVTQATGATLMLIHHTNKASMTASAASQGAARGSSALTDGVRLQINLATLNKETNKPYRLPEGELKGYVTLSITKTNYSAPQNDILLKRGEGGYLAVADVQLLPAAPERLMQEKIASRPCKIHTAPLKTRSFGS